MGEVSLWDVVYLYWAVAPVGYGFLSSFVFLIHGLLFCLYRKYSGRTDLIDFKISGYSIYFLN